MSDTWSDIQAVKNKAGSLRERMARRKKEREELVAAAGSGDLKPLLPDIKYSSTVAIKAEPGTTQTAQPTIVAKVVTPKLELGAPPEKPKLEPAPLAAVETQLQKYLSDVALVFPMDSSNLANNLTKRLSAGVTVSMVEDLLEKLAAQQLIGISRAPDKSGAVRLTVISADTTTLSVFHEPSEAKGVKRESEKSSDDSRPSKISKQADGSKDDDLESLLSMQSSKERENKKLLEEIQTILTKPTAKEQSLVEKFSSQGGAQVQEFCQYGTKEECLKMLGAQCDKLHFKKIINKHTDESLGDCSFLNTCFHMDCCKYVHYEIDYPDTMSRSLIKPELVAKKTGLTDSTTTLFPPQWVQCDLRKLDMKVLGKFSVVMADPPWDIHMELPYGTMSDDEMRKLDIPSMQDDGYIFLWVTGRAMELGRECLKLWGYERIDELIWVKTNQLQRIIRTGRTGHWLNHGKEHCLVGAKGNPKNVNRGLDCDVIVAEVRATSHKPDEIYGIIERLSPGTRKIELFGRPHNVQPNWITLGNQVDGVRLLEPDVVREFRKRYPDGNCL